MDVTVVAGAPYGAEDLAVGRELAGPFDQVDQEAELRRRETDLRSPQMGLMLVEVDDEVPMPQPARPL